jgi:hypothetical protein
MSVTQQAGTATLPAGAAAGTLIGGRFSVDPARPLPEAGGGLPVFAATDRGGAAGTVMAVQVRPDAPARGAVLSAGLADLPGLLPPLGFGPAPGPGGGPAWFVICPAPPGPPLWAEGGAQGPPWPESELLRCLIAPAAAALEALRRRGLTHRGIRPGNLFRAGAGEPVVLGCAWAAPPALHQPAVFESPHVAMCLPAGRGEGSVADDVHALGVTVLALALGRMPWADLDAEELMLARLSQGSFAALTRGARLSPLLADLLRAMLADDPSQRPSPALLMQPAAAAARRIAPRPVRRAPRPLTGGGLAAWDASTLAFAIARDPASGVRLLRAGVVDQWLRRSLDEAALAARLEEPLRPSSGDRVGEDFRAESLLAMRAVALLDPLAPLWWNGVAFRPDGLGPALVAHAGPQDGEVAGRLAGAVAADALAAFAALRPDPEEAERLRQQARAQRALLHLRGWVGGVARLRYTLNPLLACRSPLVGGGDVVPLEALLPALEAGLAHAAAPAPLLLDAEVIAFVAARQLHGLDKLLVPFADDLPPARRAVAQVRLLARLQALTAPGPLPRLGAALAAAAQPGLESWRSRALRAAKLAALEAAAAAGDLAALLAVLDDPAAREADALGLQRAKAEAGRIDAALAALAAAAPAQAAAIRSLGREIAAGAGLAALAASAVALLLG